MKIVRKSKVYKMRIEGFTRKRARRWLRAVRMDNAYDNGISQKDKNWAHQHGFTSSIVRRYGINDSNVDQFISLYDYLYLYPINDIFRKWLKDRVTTRSVLKPFHDYLPKQYFHMYFRDGEPMIIRLLDCPEGYSDDYDGLLQLLRDKGRLAFARTSGCTQDVLKYEDGKYFFNDEEFSEKDLVAYINEIINGRIRVVMEYLEEDLLPSGMEVNSNVLRLIVYNKYADNPKIGQAYFKILGPNEVDEVIEEDDDLSEFERRIRKIRVVEKTEDPDEKQGKGGKTASNDSEEPQTEIVETVIEYHNYYAPVNLEDGTFDGANYVNDDGLIDIVHEDQYGREIKGQIPHWDEMNELIEKIGKFIPQIEIMSIDVIITPDGFKLLDFTDHPLYPQSVGFNKEMTEYLQMKVAQKRAEFVSKDVKKETIGKRVNNSFWSRMAKTFSPPGMRPLIYKWWYITVQDDLLSKNGIPLHKKLWAYRRGFLSYRIPQYGITEKNYKQFISDYDYRYIRHINNKYRIWLEDKLTVKYICSDYGQFFPAYYYHFSVRNGEKRVIPLMDLPDYCDNTPESVLTLVQHVGQLACKPQRGSQGQGFYKLSYHDGKYFLNHEEATPEQILEILTDEHSQYFVTEYIQQHHDIDKIYSGAVNTMRIITFMKDGKTQEIGNAYMRFGSQKTGAVDNMGAGGMFAQIDMDTGRFHNGKIITENSILPCANHPDTGEPIEGYIPNWDLIKQGLKDLNACMPQLEYLGFDVAVTEDGMKLPEINRAPGYPKIETFNRPTIDYLLYKLEKKMEKQNITKTKK